MTTKVVTGRVRLSYANLFTAVASRDNPGAEPKFSTSILIPKSDTKTYAALKAAQEFAITAKWPKRPAKIVTTLHDGDGVKEKTGEAYGPECKGHWVMSVSSKQRPNVVDAALQPVMDAGAVRSGDYARVSLNAYCYDVSGNRGVSFGLNNVQKLADGEPLGGGRTRAEDDFTAVEEDFLA
jgi:hypothetical protein